MDHNADTKPPLPLAPRTRGFAPQRTGTIRFAVGDPNGLTSNSWRIWTTSKRDLYIKCRDNFTETKVSLHTSGRWRMGFTSEAVATDTRLLSVNEDRAWEVWDEPSARPTGIVNAFRLLFPTSELAVSPAQRTDGHWAKVIFVEASPVPDKMVAISVFITPGEPELAHPVEASQSLGSLALPNGRCAQIIAHSAPIADVMTVIEKAAARGRQLANERGVALPSTAYGYFLGRTADGGRYVVGARVYR